MTEKQNLPPIVALGLDMDGVLNTPRVCISLKKTDRKDPFGWIDPIAVDILNRWADMIRDLGYDPQIFMTSTWRTAFSDRNALEMYFSGIGLRWTVCRDHRTTGHNHEKEGDIRGDQVRAWLTRNPDITRWFLIDDDSDFYEDQKERLVLTCSMNGILVAHHEQALGIIERLCLKK